MLIKDLQAFIEVQKAFELLERNFSQKIRKQAELKAELHKIVESNKLSFGFFKRVSRESKLKSLRLKLFRLENEIVLEEKLISLAATVIITHEIPAIKIRNQERVERTIREFANARLLRIREERALWQAVINVQVGRKRRKFISKPCLDDQQYRQFRITE
jgi:hypothetical protein